MHATGLSAQGRIGERRAGGLQPLQLREQGAQGGFAEAGTDLAGSADSLLESACQMDMEGLIGKRVGSPYVSRRSSDWIKLKCKRRQ